MKQFLVIFLLGFHLLSAQEISILRAFYANDFRDWLFYDKKENELGTLRTRWQLTKDYSQWDIRLGELSGSIVLRWHDHPNEWEIRILDDLITIEPTWPGLKDSWRIHYHGKTYYLNLIPDPEGIQWTLEQDQTILCNIYNVYYMDSREWEVKRDQEKLDQNLVITSLFLVSFYSSPK
jgi:hypothetical protein